MYGVAFRYTKSAEEAQDLLQEAFLIIFDNIEQYTGKGQLGSWMRRIVVNEALKWYKKRAKQPQMLSYDDYESTIGEELVMDTEYDEEHTREVLLGFIRELPQGYKMVFNLYEIEGYSYKEIAEKLNCTMTTCRSQLSKAKNILRKKINDFNEQQKKIKTHGEK
jgi:RNA polymerase sigma-70 factor (ECF subfamily)